MNESIHYYTKLRKIVIQMYFYTWRFTANPSLGQIRRLFLFPFPVKFHVFYWDPYNTRTC